MEKRLIHLGRGGRGGDFCRGGVKNRGLWWPEMGSEVDDCVGIVGAALSSLPDKVAEMMGLMAETMVLLRGECWWSSVMMIQPAEKERE